MGSFTYQRGGDHTGVASFSFADVFRHYINFGYQHQAIALGAVVPQGTSGHFAVTGLGFEPQALLVFTDGSNLDVLNVDGFISAVGAAASPSDRWSCGLASTFGDINSRRRWFYNNRLLHSEIQASNLGNFSCDLVSFDPDGFTINVLTPPDQDVRIMGLAVRYGGIPNFAVGSAISGSSQTITPGFTPKVVYLASSMVATPNATDTTGARMAMGIADVNNGHFGIWTGASIAAPYAATSDDFYIDMTSYSDSPLELWQDADAAGPFTPQIVAKAAVSFSSSSVTISWPTNDRNHYYGWLIVGHDVEANRWTYNASQVTRTITTLYDPVGLFFFANQMGFDPPYTNHNTQTFGVSQGLGMCDKNLNQGTFVGGITDAHTFPFAELASRYGDVFTAFGAAQHEGDGLPPQSPGPQDYGRITAVSKVIKRPQIIRYR